MIKFAQKILVGVTAFAAIAGLSLTAQAAPIVTVSGDNDAPKALGPFVVNAGAAVGFSLGADYEDVSIFIDAACFDCSGDILLFEGDPGPGAILSGLVAVGSFDDTTGAIGFGSVPTLDAGDYFLIVGVDDGGIVWNGSSSPDVMTDGISSNMADLLIDVPSITSFLISTFIDYDGFFHYSLEGDRVGGSEPPEVPLPGAVFLFAAGLGCLARIRHRNG